MINHALRQRALSVLAQTLGTPEVKPELSVDWVDSLDLIEAVAALEQEFSVRILNHHLVHVKTFGEIIDLIEAAQ